MQGQLQEEKGLRRSVLGALYRSLSQDTAEWGFPLPEDLIYHIIDKYLADDFSTIQSLSLTRRSLTPYCRKLLLRALRVATIRHEKKDTPFERFATLLKDSPHVVKHVEELQIMDRHSTIAVPKSWRSDLSAAMHTIFTRKWTCLRRLHLRIHDNWDDLPKSVRSALIQAFMLTSLRELAFVGLKLPLSALCKSSNLLALELLRDSSVTLPTSPAPAQAPSLAPQSLVLKPTSPAEFRELVAANSPLKLPRLAHLTFETQRNSAEYILQALPNNVSGSLKTLSMSLLHQNRRDDRQPPSLRAFRRLENFGICEDLGGPSSSSLDWTIQALSSLPPTARLHSIELAFRYDDPTHVMAGAWERFDLLLRTRWPRLKRLTVVGYSRYPPQMDWYRLDFFQIRLPVRLPSLPTGVLQTSIKYAFDAWK